MVRIVFVCRDGLSCRSIMAKAILDTMIPGLEVVATNLEPLTSLSPDAIIPMAEIGLEIDLSLSTPLSQLAAKEFDYLITLCDSTVDEIEIRKLPFQFKNKLHLGLRNPLDPAILETDIGYSYEKFRDELITELEYFCHHILEREISSFWQGKLPSG